MWRSSRVGPSFYVNDHFQCCFLKKLTYHRLRSVQLYYKESSEVDPADLPNLLSYIISKYKFSHHFYEKEINRSPVDFSPYSIQTQDY